MNNRTRPKAKPSRSDLPPPTRSEAAFERVLAEFDTAAPSTGATCQAKLVEGPPQSDTDAYIDSLYARKAEFLDRDRYASIGDADAFPTKLVGVSFEGRQDLIAGLQPGNELTLVRQPENPHDANAIAVLFGSLHVGFIHRQMAKHLASKIDAGVRYHVRVENVTGGNGKNFGVNVFVQRESEIRAGAQAQLDRGDANRDALRRALIGERPLREAQKQVLARIESGKNTLAVLGTGRGKSFCFQFPAAYRALENAEKTLVIYPLRALANDQYEALRRRLEGFGLRIFRANGSISPEERRELMGALATGEWDMVLATPEFLQFHRQAFSSASAPSLVVVDEAHHVYESNHRAAYGNLGRTIASLGDPQVLALTATAGDAAFERMVSDLKIDAWVIDPTVRENLHVVDARSTKDKLQYLGDLFDDGDKGIVYCNSRKEATKVAETLRKRFGNIVMFYHAGMTSPDRASVEKFFREGELRIVVATSAFGEGIDLPDVRHVVLYHLNFDFIEFNQQAGRAGRDGESAQIHLLFGEPDRRINDFIIAREAPSLHVLRELYRGMKGLSQDGVLRMAHTDIERTLELDMVNDRTVAAALRIFADCELVELGSDDDGRYTRFLPVRQKLDLTQNERYAEGIAEREAFDRFCELALTARAAALQQIINRPIYPERTQLLR
ncbi:MAG: DEAD/DEAH box helicase [Candidatus Eremiobacteraeota bacterium]|nr:DEAD/DEAH box helicase [Candidatus Eremiobacteraeota bacterium]